MSREQNRPGIAAHGLSATNYRLTQASSANFLTMATMSPRATIYTVGHSTHPIDEFLEMLAAYQIRQLVDIRRYPGSRRYPQFGHEALAASLRKSGIEYSHLESLGGRRMPRED